MSIDAVANPTYQPAMRIITAITNGFPAIVTTSFAHQYLSGLIVRLFIPRYFGMVQADKLQGAITVIDDVTFSINLDTTYFDPFVVPVQTPLTAQLANVVPFGELTSQFNGSTANVLPYPLKPGVYSKEQ